MDVVSNELELAPPSAVTQAAYDFAAALADTPQFKAFEEDAERLEALCRALRLHGLQSRPLLRHGIPFRETLKVAEEVDPSLIILGSHGRSAVQEMLSGSTFENVVRLSRHLVLAVRQEANKSAQATRGVTQR